MSTYVPNGFFELASLNSSAALHTSPLEVSLPASTLNQPEAQRSLESRIRCQNVSQTKEHRRWARQSKKSGKDEGG